MNPVTRTTRLILRREGIALFALFGLLIAAYLSLYRLGLIGTLVCTEDGGCGTVQLSRWSKLLGVPVPFIGVLAYSSILALALAGTAAAHVHSNVIARWLFGLGSTALLFAAYNTAMEAFVIRAFCPWCLACAGCAFTIFLLSLPELRWSRGPGSVAEALLAP